MIEKYDKSVSSEKHEKKTDTESLTRSEWVTHYLSKINLPKETMLSTTAANTLIQKHAIAVYKNRLKVTNGKTPSVLVLAETLADMEIHFEEILENAFD